MIGPDQDLHDFPPWIWPYINVARLAEFKAAGRVAAVSTAVAPRAAVDAHVHAIFAAAALKATAAQIGDKAIGSALSGAASKALSVAIDDCGNEPPRKPWPHPPRHIQMFEVAGRLAVAAAELEKNEALSSELIGAVRTLADRAQQLAG
jgi:hypothetical protein